MNFQIERTESDVMKFVMFEEKKVNQYGYSIDSKKEQHQISLNISRNTIIGVQKLP